MDRVLPEAEVLGWEALVEGLVLSDADDRHVLAAAIASGAATILTMSLRDFLPAALAPRGIIAAHPDPFLCRLYDADPEVMRASAAAARANLSRSAPTFGAVLEALERQDLPGLAARLRAGGMSPPPRPWPVCVRGRYCAGGRDGERHRARRRRGEAALGAPPGADGGASLGLRAAARARPRRRGGAGRPVGR